MLVKQMWAGLAWASTALAASLVQVNNWGGNPSNIRMFQYVPDRVATNPAIIVALHPCGGNARNWFSGTRLPSYADSNGFILIYPETPNQSNCWDVHNPASLTHGAGGDALGIVNMVSYVRQQYSADASRVFVMGFSSGGMMTNVMAGSYPDVFAAGGASSGTAHACFAGAPGATPMSANQTCAQGLQRTPQEWGNFVRNSYPGYTGRRPRMLISHGQTDTLVRPQCALEALKQWSNVHGITTSRTVANTPSSGWTQHLYGDGSQVVGYISSSLGHGYPSGQEELLLRFFGILGGGVAPPPTIPPPSVPPPTSCSSLYGQCGGQNWSGPKCCSQGTCRFSNNWYSQCL